MRSVHDGMADLFGLVGVVSGSRLRARFYDGGGGALLLRDWFDTELGIPCRFVRTRAGPTRCLPVTTTLFLDSTCAMPVLHEACSDPPPPYVTLMTPWVGGAVYATGDKYTGGLRQISGASGLCIDARASSSGSAVGWLYGAGAEISPERFVAATVRWVPTVGGSIRTVQADDGSSQVTVEMPELRLNPLTPPEPPAFAPGAIVYIGSGRLRLPAYADAQGKVIGWTPIDFGFLDTQVGLWCQVATFADGLRCVPRNVHVSEAVARTACGPPPSAEDGAWAPVTDVTQ